MSVTVAAIAAKSVDLFLSLGLIDSRHGAPPRLEGPEIWINGAETARLSVDRGPKEGGGYANLFTPVSGIILRGSLLADTHPGFGAQWRDQALSLEILGIAHLAREDFTIGFPCPGGEGSAVGSRATDTLTNDFAPVPLLASLPLLAAGHGAPGYCAAVAKRQKIPT